MADVPVMAEQPVNRFFNPGNVLGAPFAGAWDPPLREQDLDWIARAGFDMIACLCALAVTGTA